MRDRDALYGRRFQKRLRTMRIEERVTARQSPWQNIFAERVIWSIRRECLDYIIILSKDHLARILSSYVGYYNRSRTHHRLNLDCPEPRRVQPPSEGKDIVAIPYVGGLHHRYERRRAS
jgi:putative transposase